MEKDVKLTSITLAVVPSKRKGVSPHRIMLDPHNTVFCTCEGWHFNDHTCEHLERFKQFLRERNPGDPL